MMEASIPNPSNVEIAIRVLVESKSAGGIIGKGGATINLLRQESGANIDMATSVPGATKRICTVRGLVDCVASALHLIADTIAANKLRANKALEDKDAKPFDIDPSDTSVNIVLLIPNNIIGGVIGKGGSKISVTRENSGANIRVSDKTMEGSSEKSCTVSGTSEQVYKALVLIMYSVIENADKLQGRGDQLYWPRPDPHMLMAQYASHASTPMMYGHVEPEATESIVIPIPESLIGYVIGRGGSSINEIRARSRATIKISEKGPPGTERLVNITGPRASNEMAVALINEKLSMYDVSNSL